MMQSLPEATNFKVFRGKKSTYLVFRDFGVNGGPAYCEIKMGIPKEMQELEAKRKKEAEKRMKEAERQREIKDRLAFAKQQNRGKIQRAGANAMAKIENALRERIEKEVDEGLPGEKLVRKSDIPDPEDMVPKAFRRKEEEKDVNGDE